jgi:hypothetical protein
MRTENQIKRKLNELILLKKSLETRSAELKAGEQEAEERSLQLQLERLEESIALLEWVLDAPVGRYHA